MSDITEKFRILDPQVKKALAEVAKQSQDANENTYEVVDQTLTYNDINRLKNGKRYIDRAKTTSNPRLVFKVKNRLHTIELSSLLEDQTILNQALQDIATLQTDLQAAEDLNQDLETRLGQAEQDVATLQQDVGTLQQDVGTLQQDVGTLQQDVGTLQQDVATLQQDVAGLIPVIVDVTTASLTTSAGATQSVVVNDAAFAVGKKLFTTPISGGTNSQGYPIIVSAISGSGQATFVILNAGAQAASEDFNGTLTFSVRVL